MNINYAYNKSFALDSLPNKTCNYLQALVNSFTFSLSSFKNLAKHCWMHHKQTAQFSSRVFTRFQKTLRKKHTNTIFCVMLRVIIHQLDMLRIKVIQMLVYQNKPLQNIIYKLVVPYRNLTT